MFNFRSLAAMIGEEEDGEDGGGGEKAGGRGGSEHVEDSGASAAEDGGSRVAAERREAPPSSPPRPAGSPAFSPGPGCLVGGEGGNRSRATSGESSSSAPPPIYVEHAPGTDGEAGGGVDRIAPVPAPARVVREVDRKEGGGVRVLGHRGAGGEVRVPEATR
ncbi:SNF1-interacting protein [Teratosphaeriaceae sp. CCFEE 6253]|nr:SNF1-interacting protein [Teratosphaeriaceae sp. CCFEE 6253]